MGAWIAVSMAFRQLQEFHLFMQFAGVDSSSPPVIDIPRQCMELLDLGKPAPDACAEPRLGRVAEQEFGLEDAAQVPVGAVEVTYSMRIFQVSASRFQIHVL